MGEERLKFGIVGYGKMGKLVHKVLEERGETVGAVVDPNVREDIHKRNVIPAPTFGTEIADSAICFTSPDAGYQTARALLEKGIDAIVGTTKWYLNPDKTVNQPMIAELGDIAKQNECRFVYAPNFSIGMNAFWQNLMQLAPVLAKLGYDVAVVEEHHTGKADISGTAIAIGNILLGAYTPKKTKLKVNNFDQKIAPDEIGIAVVRAGDIPGTHKVIFQSPVDRIVLEHVVSDRAIFAKGAVDTAYWARTQQPGGYCITDRLK